MHAIAIIIALNYKQIGNNPERISKTKLFINRYDWKDINFLSHKEDGKFLKKIID